MSAQTREINQENSTERYQDTPLVRLSADGCTAIVNMIKHPAPASDSLKAAIKRHRNKL